MFEDTNFDFEDDGVLGTSFLPIKSSTQTSSSQKRPSQELEKETFKKLKLSDNQTSCSKDKSSVTSSGNLQDPLYSTSKVVKRKFPGPAGLLPDRPGRDKSVLDLISNETYKTDDSHDLLLCSQRTVSVFEDGPWKEMTKDYYVPNGVCPYKKYNVGWIKKQAALKKLLVNHKAPFLAAIIESLEIFDHKVPVINVMLKDSTGEIHGTVLHSLYEEYSSFFTVGSVLVLKQFGVLSTSYNNHCLTITPNNLVTIYHLELPKKQPNDDKFIEQSGTVKKIVIQDCTIDEIIKKYDEDVLAKEQKKKSINFGKIHQNHGMLRTRSNESVSDSRSSDNRLQRDSSFVVPRLGSSFNRINRGNDTNLNLLEELSKTVANDATSKKKCSFKQTDSSKGTEAFPQSSLVDSGAKASEKDCDILINTHQSQISVKPDNKEHSEIWKNLLEDVDTESLFGDF